MAEPLEPLIVDVAGDGTRATVRVIGELDLATVPQLRERTRGVLDHGQGDLAIDLSAVSFIDSTALSVLVDLHRRLSDVGRTMSIGPVSPAVQRVLTVSGLGAVFGADAARLDAIAD